MIVDLVNVTTRDGVRLDGTWRKPPLEHASQLWVDVVIFHHGVGGNFYGSGMFDRYNKALLKRDARYCASTIAAMTRSAVPRLAQWPRGHGCWTNSMRPMRHPGAEDKQGMPV